MKLDPATMREAARQLREEADPADYGPMTAGVLESMARRFENEAKAAEKAKTAPGPASNPAREATMSEKHRTAATMLLSQTIWRLVQQSTSQYDADIDRVAKALASAEAAAYARGLADGAERERAAVVAYLRHGFGPEQAKLIKSGKHLEKSE